jgi:3-oxoacyl-[acyl-carrier-protein] synthase II
LDSEGITPALSFRLVDMEVFINGIGNISPQRTFDNSLFLDEIIRHEGPFLKCIEPDNNDILPKGTLPRRLSRSLRIGVTAAALSLKDASVIEPDAIVTGTGMGMLADTEKFLTTMIDNQEKFLNPTSFIQSTHNTVAAYIAVMLNCNKYNITYVHGSLSFENALLNAILLLQEHPDHTILVGGNDEITEQHREIKTVNHRFKKEHINHLKLAECESEGTVPGEGSVFFTLTAKKDLNSYAVIQGLETYYKPESLFETDRRISEFLTSKQLSANRIDLVILGLNGDLNANKVYQHLQNGLFKNTNQAYFKHLCGEYPTSSAFGVWLAANILRKKTIPDIIRLNDTLTPGPFRNILIYNHDRNVNHSLILVSETV